MERRHAAGHVRDLRKRLPFLRPLRPGNPSYLIWIGDIAELANSFWGTGSAQSLRLAAALRRDSGAISSESPDREYLDRLRAVDGVLVEFEAELKQEQ